MSASWRRYKIRYLPSLLPSFHPCSLPSFLATFLPCFRPYTVPSFLRSAGAAPLEPPQVPQPRELRDLYVGKVFPQRGHRSHPRSGGLRRQTTTSASGHSSCSDSCHNKTPRYSPSRRHCTRRSAPCGEGPGRAEDRETIFGWCQEENIRWHGQVLRRGHSAVRYCVRRRRRRGPVGEGASPALRKEKDQDQKAQSAERPPTAVTTHITVAGCPRKEGNAPHGRQTKGHCQLQ